MLLVHVSLKKCTLHVSFVSCENQVTQQVSGTSDEIYGMRLERTLEYCQVFGPENLALPTVLSKKPTSLNVTTQRIFINADGEIP